MYVRLVIFFALLFAFILLEHIVPRRKPLAPLKGRFCNLGLSVLNSGLSAFLPFSVYLTALSVERKEIGFTFLIDWPVWAEWLLVLIILDLAIYFQHLLSHIVPLFWHLHKVHHADADLNVTTAVRFHTLEILLSLILKIAVVFLLGAPAGAVLLFEALLNGFSLFNHTNCNIPRRADRFLRFLFVTPDMHRIHHSILIRETNSNFGFCISLWDRLFGTYRKDPATDHTEMKLGISPYRKGEERKFLGCFLMPFDGTGGHYSLKGIGRMPQGRDKVSSSRME